MAGMQAARSAAALALLAPLAACAGSSSGGTAAPPVSSSSASPPATRPAPQGDPTAAAMASYLKGLAANHRFTGAALVIRHGQVLARFAAGEADEKKHVAVRPDTVLRIA